MKKTRILSILLSISLVVLLIPVTPFGVISKVEAATICPPHNWDDYGICTNCGACDRIQATETWTEWNTNNALPTEAGYYYLSTDVTLTSTWEVPAGTTYLDLNGHVIKQTHQGDRVIQVSKNIELNLYDTNSTTPHYYTYSNDAWILYEGTTPSEESVMKFDEIDTANPKQYVLIPGGAITGGKIGNAKGAGVYVAGTFNMNGGTIVGCQANLSTNYWGGGVSVSEGGTFNMNGGIIAGNLSTWDGGGVLVENGSFNMLSGNIKYNHSPEGKGGGVAVWSNGTFVMSGGTISENKASDGGAINIQGNLTIYGGEISGNKSKSDKGAVCFDSGTLTIGKSPVVKDNLGSCGDNYTGGSTCNVWINNDKSITLGSGDYAPKTGMEVGVTMLNSTGAFTGTAEQAQAGFFFADNKDGAVKYGINYNNSKLEIIKIIEIKNADGQHSSYKYNIDDVDTHPGYISLRGWVYASDTQSQVQLSAYLPQNFYPGTESTKEYTLEMRQDVINAYQLASGLKTGFNLTIPVKAGSYSSTAPQDTDKDKWIVFHGAGGSTDPERLFWINYTVPQPTATFDKQNGSGGTDSILVDYMTTNPAIEAPTREGYLFQGYFTEPSGAGEKYWNADGTGASKWLLTGSQTVYAYWLKTVEDISAKTGLIYTGLEQTGVATGTGYTLTSNRAISAGSYTATATLESGYVWSNGSTDAKEINWSIAKAPLKVTAKDKSITFGDAAANNGVEYSGFVNSETSSVLGGELVYAYMSQGGTPQVYTTNSAIGTYDIIPSGLTSDNYEISFVKGVLTVNPAKEDPEPHRPWRPYRPVTPVTPVEPTFTNPFVDVAEGTYYYDAVLWAAKTGITDGVDATHFAPEKITSRAQMVTFLWRAAGCPVSSLKTCPFTDVAEGTYFYDAVLWALENGITDGTSATTFSPDKEVSRAQSVTFLARLNGVKDDATGYTSNFTDLKAGAYYNNAVAWAFENGITDGTSATTFSPDNDCLRCQVVTYLYRNFVKAE